MNHLEASSFGDEMVKISGFEDVKSVAKEVGPYALGAGIGSGIGFALRSLGKGRLRKMSPGMQAGLLSAASIAGSAVTGAMADRMRRIANDSKERNR